MPRETSERFDRRARLPCFLYSSFRACRERKLEFREGHDGGGDVLAEISPVEGSDEAVELVAALAGIQEVELDRMVLRARFPILVCRVREVAPTGITQLLGVLDLVQCVQEERQVGTWTAR